MGMDGNGLSVADALALGKENNGMFGDGNGSWIFFLFSHYGTACNNGCGC